MSIQSFVEKIQKDGKDELVKIRELQKILDQITEQEQVLYTVHITNNK
jgi:hypothetical protein